MAIRAINVDKNIKDMTKQEILSALADQGDKNVSSGKHLRAPQGDPLTWEFDRRTRELLDAFHAIFEPEENLAAEDVELFCTCNGPDDGRPMIECSNDSACLLKWFHLDCIGMGINEVPDEREDWFCKCCVDNKLAKLRNNGPKSMFKSVVKKASAYQVDGYNAIGEAATTVVADEEEFKRKLKESNRKSHARPTEKQKQKQKRHTISTTSSKLVDMPWSSSGTPKLWTAEVDGAVVKHPEVAESYSLPSVASARATFLHGAISAATDPTTNASFKTSSTYDGEFEISHPSAEPGGKKNRGSWTAEEKAHLIQCVIASNKAGLSGERLWSDVYPKMLARGIHRPLGGMRMTWLRELREQVNIDERRRKNASKMKTAVQKSKKEKEADRAAAKDTAMAKEVEVRREKTPDPAKVSADAVALAMTYSHLIACHVRAMSTGN